MLSIVQTLGLLAGYDGHMDWDGGWGAVMIISMVIFWVLVVVAAVWLVRDLAGARSSRRSPAEQPVELLDRRLAEGAISVEEYQERRNLLERRP